MFCSDSRPVVDAPCYSVITTQLIHIMVNLHGKMTPQSREIFRNNRLPVAASAILRERCEACTFSVGPLWCLKTQCTGSYQSSYLTLVDTNGTKDFIQQRFFQVCSVKKIWISWLIWYVYNTNMRHRGTWIFSNHQFNGNLQYKTHRDFWLIAVNIAGYWWSSDHMGQIHTDLVNNQQRTSQEPLGYS